MKAPVSQLSGLILASNWIKSFSAFCLMKKTEPLRCLYLSWLRHFTASLFSRPRRNFASDHPPPLQILLSNYSFVYVCCHQPMTIPNHYNAVSLTRFGKCGVVNTNCPCLSFPQIYNCRNEFLTATNLIICSFRNSLRMEMTIWRREQIFYSY